MKKIIVNVSVLLSVFIAGALLQRTFLKYPDHRPTTVSESKKEKRKILYWVAPMNPNYRRSKPGKSPMGMDLVPVYANGQANGKNIIKISPAVENNLGVKTATVKRENLSRIVTTVGYVTADENTIDHIHTYADGWIKVLHVKTTGEVVKKGQLLLELYSPTLVNAQDELLLALTNNSRRLIQAGEKKLLTLGMAQSQINRLRKSREVMNLIKIYATHAGIVSKLNVREGTFVKPTVEIMRIEDLSQIWIIADVFERQADWIEAGQTAIATLPYLPSKAWKGTVDYVYPQLDPDTHTLRVRLTFSNPGLRIKPKMYANIKIQSSTIKNAITIPRLSLIRTGDGDRVIVALGNGQYRAQPVVVGIESGDRYQILSGLSVGTKVVASGHFLIDSESNLRASFERIQPAGDSTLKQRLNRKHSH